MAVKYICFLFSDGTSFVGYCMKNWIFLSQKKTKKFILVQFELEYFDACVNKLAKPVFI